MAVADSSIAGLARSGKCARAIRRPARRRRARKRPAPRKAPNAASSPTAAAARSIAGRALRRVKSAVAVVRTSADCRAARRSLVRHKTSHAVRQATVAAGCSTAGLARSRARRAAVPESLVNAARRAVRPEPASSPARSAASSLTDVAGSSIAGRAQPDRVAALAAFRTSAPEGKSANRMLVTRRGRASSRPRHRSGRIAIEWRSHRQRAPSTSTATCRRTLHTW